jgi:hypothetical protein
MTGGVVKAGAVTAGGPVVVAGKLQAGAVAAGTVTAGSVSGPVTAGTMIVGGGGGGAAAGAGAGGGTAARYPADRPLVRLSEPPRSVPRAPAGLLSRAPLPQGSSGVRLAAAAGLPLEYDGAGGAAVVFAPGYAAPAPMPSFASERTRILSRQDDGGASAEAAAEVAEASADSGPASAPAAPGAGGGGGGNIDEIYEQVVDRLRRDLLVEREKMGDMLGDLL